MEFGTEGTRREAKRVVKKSLSQLMPGSFRHSTRPIAHLVTNAGFAIHDLDVFYEDGAPKTLGADSLGVAGAPLASADTQGRRSP